MRNIGFTGTRKGMTQTQLERVRTFLMKHYWAGMEFHHGDCVGADAEAALIAAECGYRIACHPPSDASKRAFVGYDVIYPEKPYLARDREIVDAVQVLLAAPKENGEVIRSGTWATVRYARKRNVLVELCLPVEPR